MTPYYNERELKPTIGLDNENEFVTLRVLEGGVLSYGYGKTEKAAKEGSEVDGYRTAALAVYKKTTKTRGKWNHIKVYTRTSHERHPDV